MQEQRYILSWIHAVQLFHPPSSGLDADALAALNHFDEVFGEQPGRHELHERRWPRQLCPHVHRVKVDLKDAPVSVSNTQSVLNEGRANHSEPVCERCDPGRLALAVIADARGFRPSPLCVAGGEVCVAGELVELLDGLPQELAGMPQLLGVTEPRRRRGGEIGELLDVGLIRNVQRGLPRNPSCQ